MEKRKREREERNAKEKIIRCVCRVGRHLPSLPSGNESCYGSQRFSLTELEPVSSELFFKYACPWTCPWELELSQSHPASVSGRLDIWPTSSSLTGHQPPGLPLPRILSRWFSQNPPHSWYFCFLIFPPWNPPLCPLAVNFHFSLLRLELSPDLPHCKIPL